MAKIFHLINSTYQVVDEKENTTLFQGTKDECIKYMGDRLVDRIVNDEVLLGVFKRLADR